MYTVQRNPVCVSKTSPDRPDCTKLNRDTGRPSGPDGNYLPRFYSVVYLPLLSSVRCFCEAVNVLVLLPSLSSGPERSAR